LIENAIKIRENFVITIERGSVMKVILSRKGFDSSYGGFASPILPDGRIISLPIPSSDKEALRYSDLKLDDKTTYLDLIMQIKGKVKMKGKWVDPNNQQPSLNWDQLLQLEHHHPAKAYLQYIFCQSG
jgi:hypothetical protein